MSYRNRNESQPFKLNSLVLCLPAAERLQIDWTYLSLLVWSGSKVNKSCARWRPLSVWEKQILFSGLWGVQFKGWEKLPELYKIHISNFKTSLKLWIKCDVREEMKKTHKPSITNHQSVFVIVKFKWYKREKKMIFKSHETYLTKKVFWSLTFHPVYNRTTEQGPIRTRFLRQSVIDW